MATTRYTDSPGAAVFATPLGEAGIAWTRRGIDRLILPTAGAPDPLESAGSAATDPQAILATLVPDRASRRRPPAPVAATIRRLRRHLTGRSDPLRDVPVDLNRSAPFARRVYRALRAVDPGATTTYGELAREAGQPRAARAVGRIMGANPVPLIVPCHRCLPAGRTATGAARLGGFSSAGGARQKAQLLFLEGVILDPRHAAGIAHLRRRDPVLRRLIQLVGPYFAAPEHRLPPYDSLLRAIVFQQISVAAGRTIAARLAALTPGPHLPGPAELLTLDDAALRSAGLSPQKTRYARDLAARVSDGHLHLDTLHRRSDADVIATLTEVKGIGRWTAHMFLIFQLDRLDVLPVDDLGLRNAMQRAWNLPAPVTIAELEARAAAWRPYRSMASWYLWQASDSGGI